MKRKNFLSFLLLALVAAFLPIPSMADSFDGATLSLLWGSPFVFVLISIALGPLIAADFWHHHFGKVMFVWVIIFILPFSFAYGMGTSVTLIAHALFLEYIPFIILLFALFTVSGGILIQGNLKGSVRLNIILLVIGTVLASVMGTTGAAMLLIRPLLRANANRKYRVHVVVFFIFLVANIGGGLTPLGDPPLFLGFLKGVDFLWTLEHMLLPVVICVLILLAIFYFVDSYYFKKEMKDDDFKAEELPVEKKSQFGILGKFNIILLLCIVGSVLLSGVWRPGIQFVILDQTMQLQDVARDVLLVVISLISLLTTPKKCRLENGFNWEPILEVAKIFIAIFITIGPVISMLKAGYDGPLSSIVSLVVDGKGEPINIMYFGLTGILSAFLDNAPTYLVFFNLASGDAVTLVGTLKATLLAISMGSVFMGALTYVGNAPNFMVRSIAIQGGVQMPSFFGYMKWSFLILIPLFIVLAWVFF